ncbi:hypothetical protein JTB14_038058 [Gonioctena quinquepunctata]|nr:hypothetical protein JTB14_038058 [Gonioctena quinquepunctata]
MEFEKQTDQNHLAPEFESLSGNIIDKVPEVNVEASAIQTKLENRTTSQSQQEYLNETTPEKTDKDVTTENAVITYGQELYPGIITEIKHTGLKVKTMCKSRPNHWKWPKYDDEIWYSFEEIVRKNWSTGAS